MSKATLTQKVITTVTLELSKEEAETLLGITCHVGGYPTGPRGLIDNIANSLRTVGIMRCKTNARGTIEI